MKAALRLVGPLAVLLVWWLTTSLGWIDRIFLATPDDTARAVGRLVSSADGLADVAATLKRVALGFGIGAAVGVPLGFAFGYSRALYLAAEVVVEYCRSLPATALFPLFLVVFGIGDAAKVAVAVFVTVWIVLVNTAAGVAQANRTRLRWLSTLKPTRWQVVRHVLLYEAAPLTASGLRTCLGLSMVVVIATEMFIGSQHGLGRRIYDAQLGAGSNVPEMYAAILVAGLIGYGLNVAFQAGQRRLLHWAGR